MNKYDYLVNTHDLETLSDWGPFARDIYALSHIADRQKGVKFDFCLIQWMLCDDFIAGYGRDVRVCDTETQHRRELCWLLRCCFDTYVWEAEYNVHEYMLHGKKSIRQMLDKLLSETP